MIVNSYKELNELAETVVLKMLEDNPYNIECLDELQGVGTLPYLVYNDLCSQESIVGAMFYKIMEDKFQIKISTN